MLSSVLLVTLVVALLSLTGFGIVSSSVRFLLNNLPLFAFTVLVVCVLAPSNDGHACEKLDEFGRLLPCYPLSHSKYVGHMCRPAERRRVLRRLWRQVEYVLRKLLNPVSTGIREIWPWVSGLCKYLRDGTPVFLSTVLLILRTAYASTEVRRAALAICFACLVDYLVRYALVPEVAVLLASAGTGWTFREPLWEYLKSTGPVLSYLDCYNKELAAQSKQNARKGCLSLVKHRKYESPVTRRSQPTNPVNERTTTPNKARASPVCHPDPISTTGAHESERHTLASSPLPIRSMIDEKRKKSKRTPKAKVTEPVVAATEMHDKVIDQKPGDELVGKSAILIAIPNSELPHEKNITKAPVPSKPTSMAAAAEELQSRAPTVDPPRAKSAAPSHAPSISTHPDSPPIIIDDCRSEVNESQTKVVDQNKNEEESGQRLPAPRVTLETEAPEPEALDKNVTEDDTKRANENIVLGERGASIAEMTIAPVPQGNLAGVSASFIPAAPSIPSVSKDYLQAEPTPSTDKVTTEQYVHISDENRPQPLSAGLVIGKATPAPAPVEDVPTTTGTPAETGYSTSIPADSSHPGAPVTTTPGGKSPKQISPKLKKIIKSPSRSNSARVLRLYAPIPHFQVRVTAFVARLKKRALKKAKLDRQSKRLAAAAPASTTSIVPCVAQAQPLPAAVSETPTRAPLPAGPEPAGSTVMEVCRQPATPSEPAVIGSPMNACLDPMDEPMSPTESGPVVGFPAVECPLPAIFQSTPLAPIAVVPQVVVPPKDLVTPPTIAPRVPLSIPCKPVDAASFFKPYKLVQLPRPMASPVSVGFSGASTPQAVSTTPSPMPTTGGQSHLKQYTPAPVPRPVASTGPSWVSAGQVPAPKPAPTKPAPALKTGPTVIHNPAEEALIAAFKQSRKSSKLTETDLDCKLVVAPTAPGTCRQLGRAETKKNTASRKNVVYSMDVQGKDCVTAGEVGKDAYVYKWNLDLGTPGVKMRAPEELWKAR